MLARFIQLRTSNYRSTIFVTPNLTGNRLRSSVLLSISAQAINEPQGDYANAKANANLIIWLGSLK